MDNVQRAKTGAQLSKGASKDDLDIRNRNLVTDTEVWGQSRVAARQTWCQVWEETVHDQISVRAMAASEGSGLAVRMGGGRSRESGGKPLSLTLGPLVFPQGCFLSNMAPGPTTLGSGLVHFQSQP